MSIEVNGVSLPDIPSEVLASYPYAYIIYTSGVSYGAVATKEPAYYVSAAIANAAFDYNGALIGLKESGVVRRLYINEDEVSTATEWNDNGETTTQIITVVAVQPVLWSNYDIYEITGGNLSTGEFTYADEPYFASSVSDPNYYAPKSWYDGMARQVMRLTGTSDKLTTDEMLAGIKGVEMPPNAEDYSFGTVESEYDYGITTKGTLSGPWTGYTGGYKFTANEDMTVYGIRWFAGTTSDRWSYPGGLWDADGNLLASCIMYPSTEGSNTLFDTPVNLEAGKTYVVAASQSIMYCSASDCTFNSKITFVAGVNKGSYGTSEPVLPTDEDTGTVFGLADILIGQSVETPPSEYTVQQETMTNIANEVMRITGTTTQMSPANIIIALQGVTT